MCDLTLIHDLTPEQQSALCEVERIAMARHLSQPATKPGIPSVVCPLARFVAGDFSMEEVA